MLAIIPCTTIPTLRFGPQRPFMAATPPANDLIDFPTSPLWAAFYADQRLTPRPPDTGERIIVATPSRDLNAAEWERDGQNILDLIGWANSTALTVPSDQWHNHIPAQWPTPATLPANVTPIMPRPAPKPPTATPDYPQPAPKLEGRWRHQ